MRERTVSAPAPDAWRGWIAGRYDPCERDRWRQTLVLPILPRLMSEPDYDVAVAGAGMVGVSCASWARSEGAKVLLLDGKPPGSGASFGNAGTIATYACVPVNSPSVLRGLPSLLFSRDSPLGLDAWYALGHLSWVVSFLRNCTAERVRYITDCLGDLLSRADAGLDPLIEAAGAHDLLVNNGCLYVYSSQRSFTAAAESNDARRRNGVRFEVLDTDAVRALEPALQMPIHKGLLFDGARHVRAPQALVERIFARYVADGGGWLCDDVRKVTPADDGVTLTTASGATHRARHFVLAAGAHSRSIAGCGAQAMPLDTERGHHVLFTGRDGLLSRPVGWADAGLYATPMTSGLRVAGTVELAGLDRPKNPRRIAYLARRAQQMFGALGAPEEEWLGFRPTFPDALPAIGRSPASDRILFAFGHQHLGLTLGGITGRIIADLLQGRAPNFDIAPFDPMRFDAVRPRG